LNFLWTKHACRREIEAFTSQSEFLLLAEWLLAIGKKVSTRDFAFDEHRVARSLPPNGIGHFAAEASLLGENHSAAIRAQPRNGFLNQLGVSHAMLWFYWMAGAYGSDSKASSFSRPA
jgi:hypothetical protein